MAKDNSGSDLIEKAKLAVFFLLVVFLAFVAGGVSAQLKAPGIGDFVQRVSMAVMYLYGSGSDEGTLDAFWTATDRTADPARPIHLYDPELAGNGYNLVVSAAAQEAVLLTMQGEPLHRWARPYDRVWDADDATWRDNVYWRRVRMMRDGSLLVIFESPARTPYGLGMAKLDKDSNVIWEVSDNLHHDISIGPDGEIYALGQRINETGYAGYKRLKAPFIDDSVVVISPDGQKQREIFIIDAFLKSDYAAALDTMPDSLLGDAVHANAVQYIDAETARSFPFAKQGDLLISMREMSTIAVLDPETGTIVWARSGPWRRQHEPVMLKNGNILLFDNQGILDSTGRTRVIEFNPRAGAIDWSFDGTAKEPIVSLFFGSQQRLANGNTLITETRNGRAIEVTPEGRIAWDYRTPHRKTVDGTQYVMPLFDVVRVDPSNAAFIE